MRVSEIAEKLGLENLTPELGAGEEVDAVSGHASDLLSDVLANAPTGGVLVTIQVHMNVIAVSVHAGVSTVIFASGRIPEESVKKKALELRVRLYTSTKSTFDIVGQLYALGLRGHYE